ncbi:hypothetical protein MRF4_01210 [Methylobacterium radiotolerans]
MVPRSFHLLARAGQQTGEARGFARAEEVAFLDAERTDAQIRAIRRQRNARTLPRYVERTQRRITAGTRRRRLTRTDRGDLSE